MSMSDSVGMFLLLDFIIAGVHFFFFFFLFSF